MLIQICYSCTDTAGFLFKTAVVDVGQNGNCYNSSSSFGMDFSKLTPYQM